jgi:Entner-Doudoroff aldolase
MNIEESQQFFDQGFGDCRAMAILRGSDEATTVSLSQRAWDARLAMVEVPLQSPRSEHALRATVAAARLRGKVAGAGTITSVDLVNWAADTGAAFTVAPGFDPLVFERSLALGMPHLPGVATATEIQVAMAYGLRWLKAFPADALGLTWFSGMRGPFPGACFVATGGMTAQNALPYLKVGARAISFGSSFADLTPGQLEALQ